jgi:hypothetical protein
MATNRDFKELLSALSDEGAEFLVVGAHAVMFFTEPRYTKDLDLWVRATEDNASKVFRVLARFGAPMSDLTVADLASEGTIFQIGIAPNRIDVLTSIDGVKFEDAWPRRVHSTYGGVPFALLSKEDLVTNKRAAGRDQDLLDVKRLEAATKA